MKGQGFHGHLSRNPPSRLPGLDIDVGYPTEHLSRGARPTIRSPVSGTVEFVGGNDGTVRIRDRFGYRHSFLHMQLNYEYPLGGKIYDVGPTILRGDPIGVLGNVFGRRPIRDHLHYAIQSPDGTFLDPKNVWFDWEGNVIGVRSYEMYLLDRLLQYRDPTKFDRYDPLGHSPA
ncbi:M23 family metallopeptidase [Mesorhizobium sp.]|uniref:M23 family metallopeptidase n=1 Tax=Mesorhizobium sp. TaxID=1871066 RepID=UPI0025E316DF|nr:M23 family metallopeptidase [Mesorhizobium sp.]